MDQHSRRLGLLHSPYCIAMAVCFRVRGRRYVPAVASADALFGVKCARHTEQEQAACLHYIDDDKLNVSSQTAGFAWTYVHLIHGVVTYYLLHWHKGSPISMDQGRYDKLTFWEQLDDGVQNTVNRKFFTLVPAVLFLLATHGSDYRRQPLGLNLAVVLILVIAKFSSMHKVRLFGIGEVKTC